MADWEVILKRWGFPHQQRNGVTLVAREHAADCVQRIVGSDDHLYGYDSFIVRGDAIQPVLEFSPDWSTGEVPPLEEILAELETHPPEITHYEFVLDDGKI